MALQIFMPWSLFLILINILIKNYKEIDPNKIEDGAEDFLNQSQEDNFLNDITSSIPGIDEAMSFGEVMRMIQHMDYSCVIFDTAPTGLH